MKKEPKVIIDTNVFVSALIGKSKTFIRLYEAFVNVKFTPILSLEMRIELFEVIRRQKFKKYITSDEIKRFEELISVDSISVIATKRINICRDIKDNILLECAISSEIKPDCIVTGDNDLLILKSFHNIPIIEPQEFISQLRTAGY